MSKTKVSILFAALLAAAQLAQSQDSLSVVNKSDAGNESSTDESNMISWLYEKGVEHYKSGNYEDAISMFDGVLAVDRYHTAAAAYKKNAAKRIEKIEAKNKEATRAMAFVDIESAWNYEPTFYGAVAVEDLQTGTDPYVAAIERMEAKMKAIIIPSADFNDVNVEDVLLFLSAASRRFSEPEEEDLDIALLGMEHLTEVPTVSISFADMNLYEALQFVAQITSLKLDIRPNLVAIMPANYAPASQIITRSYDVSPDVGMDFESMTESSEATDLFGDSFTPPAPTGPIDVKEFFSVVEFPIGSSAVYQPRFHKLFVKNTQKNLKDVEKVLNGLEDEAEKLRSQQVEIETKFVEFSEGALEELGFDWTVYGSGSVAGMSMKEGNYFQETSALQGRELIAMTPTGTPLFYDPVSGQKIIEPTTTIERRETNPDNPEGPPLVFRDPNPDYRPGQNLFGASQRDNTTVFDAVATGILSTMGGSPPAMVVTDGNVDLRITAMEQQGAADVLSAPRVTTKSGNEALIRIAETHRYPQDYDVITGQRTSPVVQPQDWADFDMGVSLKVTPVVDTDSGTIDIELNPQILEFKGFDPYLVAYNAYDGGVQDVAVPAGNGAPLYANMAYFERRSAMTQVTIADGGTVVLGGMIGERTETFRDQVPIIGDIPYLGRLFRTEGSRTSKKNLTIFVKATRIDGKGETRAEREMARKTAAN